MVAKQISEDEVREMGMPDDYAEIFKFYHEFGYYGGESVSPLAKTLNPNMKDLRSFLRANHDWHAVFA